MPAAKAVDVVIEVGTKRVFASAIDYPGWCRSGKTEALAIEQLLAYRDRYAAVALRAGVKVPTFTEATIVERVNGNATTDFGAPAIPAQSELLSKTKAQQVKLDRLLDACHQAFDDAVELAPAELRKGPRGGGRDTAKMALHVSDVAKAYERKCAKGDWTPAYTARRMAWHYTDHCWEIQDRTD